MPARPPVRRKNRRPARPAVRPTTPRSAAVGEEDGASAQTVAAAPARSRQQQPPMSSTRAAMIERATALAKLDVLYMRHDLRNVAAIAGLMLAAIVALSFVPGLR